MTAERPTYVIVTPAFNEAAYIERTIQSVVRQTIRPVRWVIVDDGSTDPTAQIVQRYARQYDWMRYLRRERVPGQTYYASNVYALLAGYEAVRDLSFEYLAILDADIVLCDRYYEEVFHRLEMNRDMGIAAGGLLELINGKLRELEFDRYSTPKAFQVFRRACYGQVGGYVPCKHGGEDTCTEILARMNGWKTWSFPDIQAIHLKPLGTAGGRHVLRARFQQGLADYCLSTHPAFMLAKCMRRCLKDLPRPLAGFARFAGFLYGYLTRESRELPDDARRYVRAEQMRRLMACIGAAPPLWRPIQPESTVEQPPLPSACECRTEMGS